MPSSALTDSSFGFLKNKFKRSRHDKGVLKIENGLDVFETIQVEKTYLQVAKQISSYIRTTGLCSGSLLPSEQKLAQLMGVGRSSVREALTALKVAGVIDSRPGYGNFVTNYTQGHEADPMYSDLINNIMPEDFNEVLEARNSVEPSIAALAAKKAKNEDIKLLYEILEEMSAVGNDRATVTKMNIRLHQQIANCTYNKLLIGLENCFMEKFGEDGYHHYLVRMLGFAERTRTMHNEHRSIVDAIANHDLKAARTAMQHHLEAVNIVEELVQQCPTE